MDIDLARLLRPWKQVKIPVRPAKFNYAYALVQSGFSMSDESCAAAEAVKLEEPRSVTLVKCDPGEFGVIMPPGINESEFLEKYAVNGVRRYAPAVALEFALALEVVPDKFRWEFGMNDVETVLKSRGKDSQWLCRFILVSSSRKEAFASLTCWRSKVDSHILSPGTDYIFELV